MDKSVKRQKSELGFALLLTACYFAVALFVMLHHEMWRDELEPWMIAKYSSSLRELLANMRYEGHPVLWYVVIYGVTRLFSAPEPMQYANLLLATAAVFLIARYSPLARRFKVLFAFGFYPLYQYAVTSRGYALCVCILFVFMALYPLRRTRLAPLAAVLVLLCNSDVYGWFYTVSLSVALAVGWYVDREADTRWLASKVELVISGLLVAAGLIVSLKLSAPPADGGWYSAWYLRFDWTRLLEAMRAFVFDFNVGPRWVYVAPSVALFGWFTVSICRKPVVFAAWLTFIASLGAFYYTKFLPFYWHKGMVLIFIVVCLWMSVGEKDRVLSSVRLLRLANAASGSIMTLMMWVLAFYVLYGCKWIIQDLKLPYSTAQAASSFIEQRSLQDSLIIGDVDFVAQGVSAYIDRPIYYPASRSMGRYVIWNNKRQWPLTRSELVSQVNSLRSSTKANVLLVLNYQLASSYCKEMNVELLSQFSGSIKDDENLWLYRVVAH